MRLVFYSRFLYPCFFSFFIFFFILFTSHIFFRLEKSNCYLNPNLIYPLRTSEFRVMKHKFPHKYLHLPILLSIFFRYRTSVAVYKAPSQSSSRNNLLGTKNESMPASVTLDSMALTLKVTVTLALWPRPWPRSRARRSPRNDEEGGGGDVSWNGFWGRSYTITLYYL